jgi:hypothetical protein
MFWYIDISVLEETTASVFRAGTSSSVQTFDIAGTAESGALIADFYP